MNELKQWVLENYRPEECALSYEDALDENIPYGQHVYELQGNVEKAFINGILNGTSKAAYWVGQILGMELDEPWEPEESEELCQ